jgi:hypothetical protein
LIDVFCSNLDGILLTPCMIKMDPEINPETTIVPKIIPDPPIQVFHHSSSANIPQIISEDLHIASPSTFSSLLSSQKDTGLDYNLVAVFGSQSTGKSTLVRIFPVIDIAKPIVRDWICNYGFRRWSATDYTWLMARTRRF